jgi:hypothetical protein
MEIIKNVNLKLSELSSDKRKLFSVLLAKQNAKKQNLTQIKPDLENVIPVSFKQESLLKQIFENKLPGNLIIPYEIEGEVNFEIVEESCNELIKRHKALRTFFFKSEEKYFQSFRNINLRYNVMYADLSSEVNSQKNILLQHTNQEVEYRFDLQNDMLFRLKLLKIATNKYYLISNIHQLVTDTWSNRLLAFEFVQIYKSLLETGKNNLKPILHQSDYAQWEREWIDSAEAEKQKEFWANYLSGAAPINLKTDYPRIDGVRYSLLFNNEKIIEPQIAKNFIKFCETKKITVYTGVLMCFFVLLKIYSKTDDICIGTFASLRKRTETLSMVGNLINDITIRVQVTDDMKATDFLQIVYSKQYDAQIRRELPWQIVSSLLYPNEDYSFFPLHRVLFLCSQAEETLNVTFNDSSNEIFENTGLITDINDLPWKMTLIPLPDPIEYTTRDLILSLYISKDGLRLKLWYNSILFRKETIESMLTQLEKILVQFSIESFASINSFGQ